MLRGKEEKGSPTRGFFIAHGRGVNNSGVYTRGVVEKPTAILQRGSLEVDVREECVIAHVLKGSPFLLLGRERRCKDVCRCMVRHTVLIPVACFLCKGTEESDCGSVILEGKSFEVFIYRPRGMRKREGREDYCKSGL